MLLFNEWRDIKTLSLPPNKFKENLNAFKSRYSATLTYRPSNSVNRNFLFCRISIYDHFRYSVTNYGQQTVALCRGFTVVVTAAAAVVAVVVVSSGGGGSSNSSSSSSNNTTVKVT